MHASSDPGCSCFFHLGISKLPLNEHLIPQSIPLRGPLKKINKNKQKTTFLLTWISLLRISPQLLRSVIRVSGDTDSAILSLLKIIFSSELINKLLKALKTYTQVVQVYQSDTSLTDKFQNMRFILSRPSVIRHL